MESQGKLEINGNSAYQHIDNGGVHYRFDEDGNFSIQTSYFGYGYSEIVIPYFNKEEMIKFLQQVELTESEE